MTYISGFPRPAGHYTVRVLIRSICLFFLSVLPIPIGTPVSGRSRTEIEPLIGYFSNSVVLRLALGGNPTFRELMGRVKEVSLGAYSHQDLPFEKLVEALRPDRTLNHMPFTRVMFLIQNAQAQNSRWGGVAADLLGNAGRFCHKRRNATCGISSSTGQFRAGAGADGTSARRSIRSIKRECSRFTLRLKTVSGRFRWVNGGEIWTIPRLRAGQADSSSQPRCEDHRPTRKRF